MKFDKSKVYTALNADESLIGAKGYFARDIEALKRDIENEYKIEEFRRFNDNYVYQAGTGIRFNFFYLVEPAPEKWYVYENVDGSYFKHKCSAIFQKHSYSGSEKECDSWIEDHSKPKYRPFKDCDELIETYEKKIGYEAVKHLNMPSIWVKNKKCSEKYLIIAMTDNVVVLYTDGQTFDMQELFEHCTFLDGSVCGVEE